MRTWNARPYRSSSGYLRLAASRRVTTLDSDHCNLVQCATGLYSGICRCVGAGVAFTSSSGSDNLGTGVSCFYPVTLGNGGCIIVNCSFVVSSLVNTLGRGCVFRVLFGHEENMSRRLEIALSFA